MKKMVSEVKDELKVMKEKEKVYQTEDVPETDIDDFVRRKLGHHTTPSPSNLLSSSPLSQTCVESSLSTKLNFILSEVSTQYYCVIHLSPFFPGSRAFREGKIPHIL
jgi:hypothetical protein